MLNLLRVKASIATRKCENKTEKLLKMAILLAECKNRIELLTSITPVNSAMLFFGIDFKKHDNDTKT